MDDARAVMDAAGSKRAALIGISEGGSLATLFAGTHPERCSTLILYGAFARFSDWFPTTQKLDAFMRYVDTSWPLVIVVASIASSLMHRATSTLRGVIITMPGSGVCTLDLIRHCAHHRTIARGIYRYRCVRIVLAGN